MADFKTATTVGARIAALRKARGFASAKALADAIPGDSITDSILRNIEAGRKNDLAVAQLLNLAWALRVSPMFILAPLGSPDAQLDLPNIIPELQKLTTAEFDAWASGLGGGAYRPITADERNERTQLEALHELQKERREHHRLQVILEVERDYDKRQGDRDDGGDWANTQKRIEENEDRIAQLESYLASGGWHIAELTADRTHHDGAPNHQRRDEGSRPSAS
jgi:hypothetical protein